MSEPPTNRDRSAPGPAKLRSIGSAELYRSVPACGANCAGICAWGADANCYPLVRYWRTAAGSESKLSWRAGIQAKKLEVSQQVAAKRSSTRSVTTWPRWRRAELGSSAGAKQSFRELLFNIRGRGCTGQAYDGGSEGALMISDSSR